MTRILSAADAAISWITAVTLFSIMTLTFVDVVGRSLLGSNLVGGFELTELALVILIFTSLPLASRAGDHISIDLLDASLPAGMRRLSRSLAEIIAAAALFYLAWLMMMRAGRVMTDGSVSAVLRIPYWPFVYYAAAMLAVMALLHLLYAVTPLRPAREEAGREKLPGGDSPL